MSGFVYFTDEQKQRANEVDLEDFLSRQGEKLLRSGREKRLASDHSIVWLWNILTMKWLWWRRLS